MRKSTRVPLGALLLLFLSQAWSAHVTHTPLPPPRRTWYRPGPGSGRGAAPNSGISFAVFPWELEPVGTGRRSRSFIPAGCADAHEIRWWPINLCPGAPSCRASARAQVTQVKENLETAVAQPGKQQRAQGQSHTRTMCPGAAVRDGRDVALLLSLCPAVPAPRGHRPGPCRLSSLCWGARQRPVYLSG